MNSQNKEIGWHWIHPFNIETKVENGFIKLYNNILKISKKIFLDTSEC